MLNNTGPDWAVQFMYPNTLVGKFDLSMLFGVTTGDEGGLSTETARSDEAGDLGGCDGRPHSGDAA